MRSTILGITLCAFAVTARADDAAIDKDQQALQGSWSVVKMLRDGDEGPPEARERITITIKGDAIVIKDGQNEEKAKFKIDASKKPAAIDFTPEKEEKKTA